MALSAREYERWLSEDPKTVVGGDITLEPLSVKSTDVLTFDSRVFRSSILPVHYRKKLVLLGESNEFEGFKVKATVIGFDYLLMGHHSHEGPFFSADQKQYPDGHPHFHEIDHYMAAADGGPGTRRIVLPEHADGMSAEDFLDTFFAKYRFADEAGKVLSASGETNGQAGPPPSRSAQGNLSDFF